MKIFVRKFEIYNTFNVFSLKYNYLKKALENMVDFITKCVMHITLREEIFAWIYFSKSYFSDISRGFNFAN